MNRTTAASFMFGFMLICCLQNQLHSQAKPVGISNGLEPAATAASTAGIPQQPVNRLIVIGFLGGRVAADDRMHKEAQVANDLRKRYPLDIQVDLFANRNSRRALAAVLRLLDRNGDGRLTLAEKNAARIVIFGHSWGASETVAFAGQLDKLHIPVLLTIQVDSVQKSNENDATIPGNVHEAINFYQSEGVLHGRKSISAVDANHTTILGNFQSTYRDKPVSCVGYPWYARAFMRPHIEIENDPVVWDRIEALIGAKVL